ncbi:MAG: methyl-accepting chemotaxis protein [Pseudomonadota bacterium]
MKLRQQILSLVAIPLVGLVLVSGIGLYQAKVDLDETTHVETALDYADVVSALVHELQVERSYSTGYLASQGREFGGVLSSQRDRVDGWLEEFASIHDTIALDYPELLAILDHDLEALSTTREAVSSLATTVPEASALYTGMIKDALTLTDVAFADIHLGSIALAGASFVALSEGKEAAGQERALGAAGFGAGEFTTEQLSDFVAAGAKQEFALMQSELYSREVLPGLDFSEYLEVGAIEELRRFAIAHADAGDLESVTGTDWFEVSSAWIERLRSVEVDLLAGIHALNRQEANAAFREEMLFAAAAAISLISSLVVAYLISRRFTGQVALLSDAMTSISRKEFDIEIGTVSVGSEIGDLSRALEKMRSDLQTADQQLVEAYSKSFAFDDSNSAMMIVDPQMRVTASNRATQHLLEHHKAAFRKVWTDFDPSRMLDHSIDRFHKDPEHQRAILRDPSRLPWRTDITIGDLKFELNASYVRGEDGSYAGNILQWRDVTLERMNAGVIAAIDKEQCIVEYDLDGSLIKANANFVDLVGLDIVEAAGRKHKSFLAREDASSDKQDEIWAALRKGTPHHSLLKLSVRDGETKWLRANLTPISDGSGKPFRVVMIAMDVTAAESARVEAQDAQQKDEMARDKVVRALGSSLDQLSEGDLTCEIQSPFEGEYERLRANFNAAVERLANLIEGVSQTVVGVSGNASEVSAASSDLARRTERQAAMLEQTAAAIVELTSTVQSTAENAREADTAVTEARSEAEAGGKTMQDVVGAMGRIAESSAKVAKIMAVIDDIAFQTNLLALNAGVEAARAGEAGKGFSVVASEVRALAQRASESAKEISAIITLSDEQVKSGVDLVTKAGEALDGIVSRVASTGELVGTITHAAREQATAVQEINTAISSMDQTTQHNAAMVEETSAVSVALSSDADDLKSMIAAFKTTGSAEATDKGSTYPRLAYR